MPLDPSSRSSLLESAIRLLKMNVWKGSRRTLFAIAILFLTAGYIAVSTDAFTYPQAILWHCIHGNYIYLDQHRMRLPLLWWKEGDQYSHSPTYRRAMLKIGVPSTIDFMYLQPDMRTRDTEDLIQEQKRAVSLMNNEYSDIISRQTSLFTIRTRWIPLQCEETKMGFKSKGVTYMSDFKHTLCQAPGLDSSISYSGPSSESQEAESILASFQ
jgi:hypothetical protein